MWRRSPLRVPPLSLLSDVLFETRVAARSVLDHVTGTGLRLGVTGLSRAGKTVFITALVRALTTPGARLPVFRAAAEGRIARGFFEAQPDDAVPRFAYEDHIAALTGERRWPESTRRISELRLTLDYERAGTWRGSGPKVLTLDIVDYPGEWLLDLPLLGKSYAQWSAETLESSASAARAPLAAAWRGYLAGVAPGAPASEDVARRCAELFTNYLRASRAELYALSTLPPGRFLMPGDLEGSPALTFTPLPPDGEPAAGSLAATMARRYESYKTHIVRPFFRDHFARLDRQIVLVDALAALNSGPAAVRDLQNALSQVMLAFRTGRSGWLSTVFRPRIDRILLAATKADHLHHTSHDRIEAVLRLLADRAIDRARGVGATVDTIALAAVRATREASVRHGGETLDAIVGTPLAGETLGGDTFDGDTEAAVFPGELPADPKAALRGDALALPEGEADYRFLRFRPPKAEPGPDGAPGPLPHIRLDRALQFLLGDKLG